MRLLVAVILVACTGREHREGTGNPDVDRAIELADRATPGVPTWPSGTTWLAAGHVILHAVDHGEELIGADGGTLLRIPKNGAGATQIAEFPDAQIRDLVLTSRHVIVSVFPIKGLAKKSGTLLAVPLGGGPAVELATGVDLLALLATVGDDLYTNVDRRSVFVAHEPDLAKRTRVAGVPDGTQELTRSIEALVTDGGSIGWIETDFRGTLGNVEESTAVVGRIGAAPVGLVKWLPMPSVYANAGHWYTLAPASSAAATAPGGGTYYETTMALISIDPATGQTATVSSPMMNAWSLALRHGAACIGVDGPKLEFGKNTQVVLWREGKTAVTNLATGLAHARVVAIDDERCYVAVDGGLGLAALPMR